MSSETPSNTTLRRSAQLNQREVTPISERKKKATSIRNSAREKPKISDNCKRQLAKTYSLSQENLSPRDNDGSPPVKVTTVTPGTTRSKNVPKDSEERSVETPSSRGMVGVPHCSVHSRSATPCAIHPR